MTRNARTLGCLILGLILGSVPQFGHARQPGAGAAYDQGVNAYFAGRSGQAEMLLSDAMQANAYDPRVYYFRALSLLRQGRRDEARGDMMVGATLEAQAPQRYAVGSSLERIQGPDRLLLEEFRRNARRDVVQQASATQYVRQPVRRAVPPVMTAADAAVLRENHVVPLDELARPGGPRTFAAELIEDTPLQGKAAAPLAQPLPSADAEKSNPFADDTQPAEGEAAASPAAAPATAPATTLPTPPQPNPAPAADPPAAPETPANPPVEAEDNPFGG